MPKQKAKKRPAKKAPKNPLAPLGIPRGKWGRVKVRSRRVGKRDVLEFAK